MEPANLNPISAYASNSFAHPLGQARKPVFNSTTTTLLSMVMKAKRNLGDFMHKLPTHVVAHSTGV